MADNIVEVTIKGRDDTGPAFAGATAQEKAFARTIDQSYKAQEGALRRVTQAESAHARATKLLSDAEAVLGDTVDEAGRKAGIFSGFLAGLTHQTDGSVSVFGKFWQSLKDTSGWFSALLTPVKALWIGLQGLGQAGFTLLKGLFSGSLSGAATSLGEALTTGGQSALIMAAGFGVLTAAAAALSIVLGPLLAGLALVTVGIGTFAAAAVPEVMKVIKALQASGTAGQKAWAALSPNEKAIGKQIKELGESFHSLQRAVQPEVIKAFGTGLDIVKGLLPALTPLAVAAGKALDGLLKNIDNWLKSGSGQKFIQWMQTEGPKAIATFGRVMWDITQGVGKAFDFLYKTGESFLHKWQANWLDIRSITHAAGDFIVGTFHLIESAWHEWTAAFNAVRASFDAAWNGIKGAFESGYNFIAGVASRIEGVISGIAAAFGSLPGMGGGSIPTSFGAIPNPSANIGSRAGGGIAGGLTLVGEHGPELLSIPGGSRVYSNNQSRQMLAGAADVRDVNLTVNVSPLSNPAEVGRQVSEVLGEFFRNGGTMRKPRNF